MSQLGETNQRIRRAWKHADNLANQLIMIADTYKGDFPGFAATAEKLAEGALLIREGVNGLNRLLNKL